MFYSCNVFISALELSNFIYFIYILKLRLKAVKKLLNVFDLFDHQSDVID